VPGDPKPGPQSEQPIPRLASGCRWPSVRQPFVPCVVNREHCRTMRTLGAKSIRCSRGWSFLSWKYMEEDLRLQKHSTRLLYDVKLRPVHVQSWPVSICVCISQRDEAARAEVMLPCCLPAWSVPVGDHSWAYVCWAIPFPSTHVHAVLLL
jgi:hypothetical protein